jgi:hypothetical protein
MRAISLEQGQQATVARPAVEHATHLTRHVVEQDALALRSARKLVRSAGISIDVLGGGPLLGGRAAIIGVAHRS